MLPTNGAPLARTGHAAVWTGSEMLVWGGSSGFDQATVRNDGGRFNPQTGTWSAIPTAGAPSARSSPFAVWTGTEMIIWGGLDANSQDAIGGARFNPQTGEWRAMSEENAPTARAFAASVWTGSEFIVWGGQTASFEILSGGGRYDPATDVWRTMTAVGEPTKRTANSAIWTGTGMLVWGGFNFEDRNRNDGAIYNPASDTWTPVSTNGAPRERAGHAAIWTGGEMVIWGGQTEQSEQLLLIDGARFNPTAGAWSPIQTAGAPTGRVEPRALWTGEEMIICGGWPGIEGGSVRGNGWGGRYRPASNTWAEDGVPPSTR